MGHDAGDVIQREVCAVERLVHGRGHGLGGELEHLGAVHAQYLARFARVDEFGNAQLGIDTGERCVFGGFGRRAVDVERQRGVVGKRAGERVRVVVGVRDEAAHDARSVLVPLQHRRASAVAEQHAGVTVAPARHARQALGSHHERAANGVAARGTGRSGGRTGHHALGHGQAVHEARAGGVQVERNGVLETQAAAQQPGGRGHQHVGRDGGVDDEVDGSGVDGLAVLAPAAVGKTQRLAGSGFGQIGSGFLDGNVARSDARARADPFVVRVDERFQLVVGHFQLREGLSASDDRAAHAAPSLAALSRRAFNALIIKLNGL